MPLETWMGQRRRNITHGKIYKAMPRILTTIIECRVQFQVSVLYVNTHVAHVGKALISMTTGNVQKGFHLAKALITCYNVVANRINISCFLIPARPLPHVQQGSRPFAKEGMRLDLRPDYPEALVTRLETSTCACWLQCNSGRRLKYLAA